MFPDYQKTAGLLASQDILNSAAEVHGMVCGQMSSGPGDLKPNVTAGLLNLDPLPPVVEELLMRFSRQAAESLEGGEFSFQPLLPGDDEDLERRVEALGRWCEGFNAGFAAGFGRPDAAIPEQTREVLNDFARIAQVEDKLPGGVEDRESQEEDYMEIVEYVRVAAAAVYMQNTLDEGEAGGEGGPEGSEPIH